jgi:hypothetical protein
MCLKAEHEQKNATRLRAFHFCSLCLALCSIIFFLSFFVLSSEAKVNGNCSNCHTMHNSQNGASVVRDGAGTGWNSAGNLSGGSILATPQQHLLVSSCVGCHTSTTNQTIMTVSASKIPIVFSTATPTQPLAGGNFYWVSQGSSYDSYGHNVYGISAQDSTLTTAPGRTPGACGTSCHDTLAAPPSLNNSYKGGCQGCHVFTSHHTDNNWYRFLKSHGTTLTIPLPPSGINDVDYVIGVGDPDWEYTTTSSKHNYYSGTNVDYVYGTGLSNYQTITAFCQGCHGKFHGLLGGSSPWIRHPTDILLPLTNEYSGYDPTSNYSAVAPVAWLHPSSPSRSEAVVMCLSCHRAHGAPYQKIMRWDYKGWPGNGQTNGCNVCHTSKN